MVSYLRTKELIGLPEKETKDPIESGKKSSHKKYFGSLIFLVVGIVLWKSWTKLKIECKD